MLTQVGRRHLQIFATNLHKHFGQFTRKSVRKSRLLSPWSHELDMCQKRTLAAQSAEQEEITAGLRYQQLKNRGLIRFAGLDSTEFLQGLITNDMRCIQLDGVFQKNLNCHKKAIYAFLLNVKGRVICDMIVYNIGKAPDTHIYLLELDKDMVDEVHSTMKKYRLRKKVDIAVTDELKVVAVFPYEDKPFDVNLDFGVTSSLVAAEKDPRVTAMGYRLVLPAFDKITPHLPGVTEADDPHAYQLKRLRLGIGEGPTDHPPGKALPLECNGAYLHGVSFDKGCYIGQELTARTHHTGIIRKRIMPLLLHSENNDVLQMDDIFINSDGKEAGTFRSAVGQYGLGLMRLQEAKGPLTVKRKVIGSKEAETIDGVTATASQPTWWPT